MDRQPPVLIAPIGTLPGSEAPAPPQWDAKPGRPRASPGPRIPATLRGPLAITVLAVVAGFAAWQAPPLTAPGNAPLGAEPQRVMGTTCRLLAVPPHEASAAEASAIANRALRAAEDTLRAVEIEMSTRIDDSPLSRFNRATGGERLLLPHNTLEVLHAAEAAWRSTGGAFDVTSRPLIELWKAAGKRRLAPTVEEVTAARKRSSWSELRLDATGASKRSPGVEVDLGGIAKGWAIDRAVDRMITAGATGGLVDVGGDVRVFGIPPTSERWQIQVQDPFGAGTILALHTPSGAVCTSGDYFRFNEVAGRRLSHIVDPQTGYPVAVVHSATVVASRAADADVWATALSVLGEAGFARLPASHEAMLVVGERDAPRGVATRGFLSMVVERPPFPLETATR